MLLIYTIAIRLYYLVVWFASIINQKAKKWIAGRKNQAFIRFDSSFWFHFASLGEFEQGRPVLEGLRSRFPGTRIVVTFFSPSGYEVRKNTPLADAVYYLPLDTPENARQFLAAVNPVIAVFTKYEYWYYFFSELHARQIPLFIISGIFRPGQIFFRWYGSLHRRMLGFVSYFFLQDERSAGLLKSIGYNNAAVSGDTRFDRVWQNAQAPKDIPFVEQFKHGSKLLVAGSTWPEDESLLVSLINAHPDWKFIIAPHEINNNNLERLTALLTEGSFVRYSVLKTSKEPNAPEQHVLPAPFQTLVIDNVGMLSSLYRYADIAYIGGGFGAGIHNTLEAAAFGVPVIFGPGYHKFKEAGDLIRLSAGFSITNEETLEQVFYRLSRDEQRYKQACIQASAYVEGSTGATERIINTITKGSATEAY